MINNHRLTIRLPVREADKLEAKAEAAGVTVSEFARAALARQMDIDQLAGALARELAAELRSDLQARDEARDADLATKLKIVSDQIAALSQIVAKGGRA